MRLLHKSCAVLALAGFAAAGHAEIKVTVENLNGGGGFFFTPFWVAMHNGEFDSYDGGTFAAMWPGLTELLSDHLDPDGVDVTELQERLLTIQALETARCFEENVLTDVREADVGGIFGFGYALWVFSAPVFWRDATTGIDRHWVGV